MKIPRTVPVLLFIMSSIAPGAAQDRVIARARIPFQFTAHSETLDAGIYEIRQIGAQTIRVQQPDSGLGVTLLSSQNITEGDPVKLVFRLTGDRYFLANVSAPSFAVSLPKSTQEKELAQARPEVRTVEIVGRR